ncbi:MAG: hypothetical protein ABI629_23750, partial [bacterium]
MAGLTSAPILANYFRGDDFFNLYRAVNDQPWWHFLLRMHGGHLLMTRNAVFILCYQAFGTDPRPYFALVLLTHLLNVGLVYRAACLLTARWPIACLAAGLWGTAPANFGTLGWYSVYGQVLATSACLWVLSRLAACRAGGTARSGEPLAWALALLLGSTCFGTGIGFALIMPAVAWLLLPPSPLRRRAALALGAVACAVPLLYLAAKSAAAALFALPADQLSGSTASFSLPLLVALASHGVASGLLGGLVSYIAAWIAVTALVLVVAAALRDAWRPIVAMLLLSAAAYAPIAAGRGQFALTYFGGQMDQLAGVERYHYAGPIGVVLAAAVAVSSLPLSRAWSARAVTSALLVCAASITALAIGLRPAVDHNDAARDETAQALAD